MSLFTYFFFSAFCTDTNYVKSYKKGLYVKGLLASKDVQLEFKPVENKEEYPPLKYEPNLAGQYGLKLGYNGIAISYLTTFNKYALSPSRFGKTKFKSFGLDISTKKWWYRFDYSSSKGFYVDNIGQFFKPVRSNVPPFVVPHLAVKRYSLSGMYVFNNEKYSHKSWINQWEKQYKSAGSLLLQFNVFRTITTADTTIIPWRFGEEYAELNGMKNAKIDNLICQVGYAHTFVIKHKVAIGGRVLLGPGYQARRFINVKRKTVRTKNIGLKSDFGLFIMHSGTRLNYGFLFDATTVTSRIKTLNYNASFTEGLLFVGLRFPNVRLMTNKSKLSKIRILKKWAIDADL